MTKSFAPMVANAGANLPGYQRILIRRIVADKKNGFRVCQLLHRQEGIPGTVAKRRA